ncbi:MAG: flavin reductase [Chloroflexi bacterium]|nr:flavin reductase [Chloroflexota bacterium]
MPISEDEFREVFRRWPSGVAVATTRHEDHAHGMVVGSLCSLSAAPPLVMVSAGRAGRTHNLIAAAGVFAASILGHDQAALFGRFTGHDPPHDADRFGGLAIVTAVTGAPIFPDAVAWLDCRVVARHPGPTYTIFVGEVVAAGLGAAEAAPLVYLQRQLRHLAAPGPTLLL